jgi:hypothetical protein
VRASHERWDGAGYPDGLTGERIPLGSRIIAACDAYEAMTSDRVYRRAVSHEAACAELRREAGRQFDSGVVEALIAELSVDMPAEAAGAAPAPRIADEVAAYLRTVLARPVPEHLAMPLDAAPGAAEVRHAGTPRGR